MSFFKKKTPIATTTIDILFVGLVCFYRPLFGKGRVAMLPDGRNPSGGIAPHEGILVVPKSPQHSSSNPIWNEALKKKGVIRNLPKCALTMSCVSDGDGSLDVTQHDKFSLRLTDVDPKASIDPQDANDLIRLWLRNGKLEIFRLPGSKPSDPDVALVSRVRVDHSKEIEIAFSTGDWIRLAAGTDVALANLGLGDDGTFTGNHFWIYEELVIGRRLKGTPPDSTSTVIPTLVSDHPIFKLGFPINDGGAVCGNQGCC